MRIFQKRAKSQAIPDRFTAADIRMESSTCTGETVIGFYDAAEKRLCYAELVRKTISCNAIWRVLCGTAESENQSCFTL